MRNAAKIARGFLLIWLDPAMNGFIYLGTCQTMNMNILFGYTVFYKLQGPQREAGLFLPLSSSFIHRHAPVDRPAFAPAAARGLQPQLVH
jgi:hypothetical protein